MAKPELRYHRKFVRLRRLLNEPTPHVIGYLECLWHHGYQTGDPLVGDELDVEAAADFPGERGTFTKAAHDAGFIDRDDNGQFRIHGLYEHAPEYVQKRMIRKGYAPEGAMPSVSQRGGKRSETEESGGKRSQNGAGRRKAEESGGYSQEPRTKRQEPRDKTDPQTPAEAADETRTDGRTEPEFDPVRRDEEAVKAFLAAWNAGPLKPILPRAFSLSLRGRFLALILDSWWAEHWPAAVRRAGEIPHLAAGLNRKQGRLDVSEFLRDPDFIRQILDGKYDPSPPATANGQHAGKSKRDAMFDRLLGPAGEGAGDGRA